MKVQNDAKIPQIGDIYLMKFTGTGNEQNGVRPGVVFQNNIGNQYSPNIIALPLTSSIKKTLQPTHVFIPKEIGLKMDSIVLCENPERMSKEKLGNYVCKLPESYICQIAIANLLSSSAISYIDPDTLMSVWQKALMLNTAA